MSKHGASENPMELLKDHQQPIESADVKDGIRYFGADIFAECFGDPEDPPNTLLWLANHVYEATCMIVTTATSCRLRPKRD